MPEHNADSRPAAVAQQATTSRVAPSWAASSWAAPSRVAILGLGLIGGSLLRRLVAERVPVVGYDADPVVRTAAGATYPVGDSVAEAVRDADVVVSAVPFPALTPVLTELAATGFDRILTDVTSTKVAPAELVARLCPAARYVGGHPMAGTERSGYAASDGWLFDGCSWVLCPPSTPDVSTSAISTAQPLKDWTTVAEICLTAGARVVPVTATEHDVAVAAVSHLPHLVASALSERGAAPLAGRLAAGSFRDGTRVAATRPALTAAMCGANATAVAAELDHLLAALTHARDLLTSPDPTSALETWLAPGSDVRRQWPADGGPAETLPIDHATLLALGREGGWISALSTDRTIATAHRPRR